MPVHLLQVSAKCKVLQYNCIIGRIMQASLGNTTKTIQTEINNFGNELYLCDFHTREYIYTPLGKCLTTGSSGVSTYLHNHISIMLKDTAHKANLAKPSSLTRWLIQGLIEHRWIGYKQSNKPRKYWLLKCQPSY